MQQYVTLRGRVPGFEASFCRGQTVSSSDTLWLKNTVSLSLHKQLQNGGYMSLSVATPANLLSSVSRNAEDLGNFTLRKSSFFGFMRH